MRIGYQGIEGSFSEQAAQYIASSLGFDNPTFVPLVGSQRVIDSLKSKDVRYGVVAISNNLAGIVNETFHALRNEDFDLVTTEIFPIHHCLFVKNKDINIENVTEVVSHIHAINQTEKTLKTLFPNMQAVAIEDTAIGAQRLATGQLPENTAVICSKRAGEIFGLHLVEEHIEDSSENFTEFSMFKLPSN